MKIVLNPTDSQIEIQYQGIVHVVAPKGKTIVPDEVAEFWKKVHIFIEVSDYVAEKVEKIEKKIEEKEESEQDESKPTKVGKKK